MTKPDPREVGRYDFILSSEVMEHVPPPVERPFDTLSQMLKPDGFLIMTTPYTLDGLTAEHFPSLHEYSLAAPGGKTVLVNRRRDGAIEVFENLVFHGGHGSTLEVRLFTEPSLRMTLAEAGFREVHFAAENWPEFGVEHSETWSLPIAARKGHFQPPGPELAREYREACRRATRAEHDLAALSAEYQRHIAFHNFSHAQVKQELAERTQWAWKVERDFDERTKWAKDLELEKREAVAAFEAARERASSLEQELSAARTELARLKAARWTRMGRRLGLSGL